MNNDSSESRVSKIDMYEVHRRAEGLRNFCKNNRVTESVLAKLLNVSPSTINMYKNPRGNKRRRGISDDLLRKIAEKYSVSVNDIIGKVNITQEIQDIFDEVLPAILAAFNVRFHLDPEKICFEDKLKDISKGNAITFSHAIIDIHMLLNLEMELEPLKELTFFETVADLIKYFWSRLYTAKNIVEDDLHIREDELYSHIVTSVVANLEVFLEIDQDEAVNLIARGTDTLRVFKCDEDRFRAMAFSVYDSLGLTPLFSLSLFDKFETLEDLIDDCQFIHMKNMVRKL